jgi:hypothetical protein
VAHQRKALVLAENLAKGFDVHSDTHGCGALLCLKTQGLHKEIRNAFP